MKKIIITSAVVAALLTTVHAETKVEKKSDSDFSFDRMFKDMKEAATSFSADAKDTIISMKDGAVETSQSAERTVSNVSKDTKETTIKASDDMKVMVLSF